MWLLLLLAVPLIPLVWAMFRVSRLRFVDSCGEVVPAVEVPAEVLMRLKDQVEPLMGAGFEFLGIMKESRGHGDYWQTFLTTAGGRVWAVAEEGDDVDAGRRVSLMSFGSDGGVVITRDGDEHFGSVESGVVIRSQSFISAIEQSESHAELVAAESLPIVEVEPEAFLSRYQRMGSKVLDLLFEKGWLEETREKSMKVSVAKLPVVALAWLQQEWKRRQRNKKGVSWLLTQNLGNSESVDSRGELVEEELSIPAEEILSPEGEGDANSSKEERLEAVAEAAPESAIRDELNSAESVAVDSMVKAMAVEPIDAAVQKKVAAEIGEELADKKEEEKPVVMVPEKDGLPRDWALYQKQSSKKSWAYWFGGFGGRAFLFVSLLVFAGWMALSSGWGFRVIIFGLVALLIHELGHAVVMLLRRSWDWSQFLLPIPRPMTAKSWLVRGGFEELLTVLAGPLPGLILGWVILGRAYFGVPASDLVLDAALAFVVVNAFTLLPFLPLDGGRLLDLAFLREMPLLRVVGLIFTGLVFLGLSFVGGGLLTGVLALIMFAGIPAARRRSKLLPWLRANCKDGEEERVVTAFSVARERSQRKSFKGAGGMAKLDELVGLGQARKLGLLGGMLAILVLFVSWISPFVLPGYALVTNGKEWFKFDKQVQERSKEYLGNLREVQVSKDGDPEQQSAAVMEVFADLSHWQERLEESPSQPEKVFSNEVDIHGLRTMKWRLAAHWIAEAPEKRQPVAREAIRALRREAIRTADEGESESMQAFRDLSYALRIVIECEPRHSLDAWVSWFELEREILKEVEDVSSRYSLADTHLKWFEGALDQCPRPTSRKVAGLLLAESSGVEGLVRNFDLKSLLSQKSQGGGPGRSFLAAVRGAGDLVSVESLQEQQKLAESFAGSRTLSEALAKLATKGEPPLEVEEVLQRVGRNYSYRQVAKSALTVKRLGMSGASEELALLRKDYGFTARLDKTGERESLKLQRVVSTGEVVEMEWLLRQ